MKDDIRKELQDMKTSHQYQINIVSDRLIQYNEDLKEHEAAVDRKFDKWPLISGEFEP